MERALPRREGQELTAAEQIGELIAAGWVQTDTAARIGVGRDTVRRLLGREPTPVGRPHDMVYKAGR